MRANTIRRMAAVAALVPTLALVGVAVPASADTPRQDAVLTRLKTRGDAEIARRLATLDQLSSGLSQASHLTAADKSTLNTILNNDKSGLTTLRTKIDADTDVATARVDVQSIVTSFRIYVLVVPQVRLVRAADLGLDAATRLDQVASRLQTAIDADKTAGKDVTKAQAAVDDLKAQTKAASGLLTPVPGQIVAITPSQWPGAQSTLKSARDAVRNARHDLQTARGDARTALTDLPH